MADSPAEKIRKKLERTFDDLARDIEELDEALDINFDSDIPVSEKKAKDTKRRDI